MSAATSALDMRLRARLDSIRQSMQPRDTPSSFVSLPSDLALSMPMSSLAFERNVARNVERPPSALIAVQSCPSVASASGDAVPMVHLCWMVGVGIALAAALILYLRRGKKQCERKLRKSVSHKRMHQQSSSVEPDSSDEDDEDHIATGATVLPVVPPHTHHRYHHSHTGGGVIEFDDIPQRQPLHHPPQYQPSHQQQELLTSSQCSSFMF